MKKTDYLNELERNLIQLNSNSVGRRAFLASLPVLMAGCATSRHRHREGDNRGQEAALNPEGERQMTQDYLPKMRKEYPPVDNKEVQAYITTLGQSIVAQNDLHQKPYTYNFTVVQAKAVNAFALPAGEVFVTVPLLKMAATEAELAGVVGHEIGHIQARHTAERIAAAKKEKSKSFLFGLGGAVLGGAAGFALGKLLCSKQDRECLARAALYGSAAGSAGGLLIQKFAFMANSREDEMEADRIGFKTAYKAGFSKDHVGLFYNKLLKMEQEYKKNHNKLLAPLADAMSTHPPSKERVDQMNQMAAQAPKRKGSVVNSTKFEKIKSMV